MNPSLTKVRIKQRHFLTQCHYCAPLRDLDEPTNYIHWQEWALRKSQVYKQVQCPKCERYTIWIEKIDDRS